MKAPARLLSAFVLCTSLGLAACDQHEPLSSTQGSALSADLAGSGVFQFEALATSAACTDGGNAAAPLVLPSGFSQTVVAGEPDYPDLPDMNTVNETGGSAGRFLYRPHEVTSGGAVTVTDLETGATRTLAQRNDWERLDGIVWTPWGTLLTAEETSAAAFKDPGVPQAEAGLVYEIDPVSAAVTVRPAIGSRAHEGLRFDSQGNLYGISETGPGYIYRFAPARPGDLSSGQLYALKVADASRTGEAEWVPLPADSAQVNSVRAAAMAGATGWTRPEDVEIGDHTLYVAITGENLVLAIDLRAAGGGGAHATAFVRNYVQAGVNAPSSRATNAFTFPDNLALDRSGNLYITEDPGGETPSKTIGDDIWMATPDKGQTGLAGSVVRFATLTDCNAEPTGIYFGKRGPTSLLVNIQHRGGDGLDKSLAITAGTE